MFINRVQLAAIALVAVFTAGIFFMAGQGSEDRNRFMRECQDNGLRHFQCTAIWRGGASMMIIPTPAYNYMLPVDPN